jgi:hypothetical protein
MVYTDVNLLDENTAGRSKNKHTKTVEVYVGVLLPECTSKS